MNPEKYLVTFLSIYQQRESSKDSGPFWKNVVSLYPTEAPHPSYPFLSPAHAAASFVETASFCVRIACEDFAIATDVLGPTSLNYDAQRFSVAQGWGRTQEHKCWLV